MITTGSCTSSFRAIASDRSRNTCRIRVRVCVCDRGQKTRRVSAKGGSGDGRTNTLNPLLRASDADSMERLKTKSHLRNVDPSRLLLCSLFLGSACFPSRLWAPRCVRGSEKISRESSSRVDPILRPIKSSDFAWSQATQAERYIKPSCRRQ